MFITTIRITTQERGDTSRMIRLGLKVVQYIAYVDGNPPGAIDPLGLVGSAIATAGGRTALGGSAL